MAHLDEKAVLMQRMEDSSLRPLWRLTNVFFRVRNGALTLKDVKNEGWTDYVYENTGGNDKMSIEKTRLLHENPPIAR